MIVIMMGTTLYLVYISTVFHGNFTRASKKIHSLTTKFYTTEFPANKKQAISSVEHQKMFGKFSSKRFSSSSKKEKAPSKSSSRKYIVRKELGEEGLEQIQFDGSEARTILKKLGFDKPQHMENKTWRFPVDVVDDDTQKKYSLELRQDEKFGPFGFHEDWAEKVVADRGFDGDEEIGFYVHPKTGDFHFSVLNTTAAASDSDE